jgi:putative phage-type endonuclease
LIEQRTDEWFAARLGDVTASRVSDVVARIKTGWGASRQKYKDDLIAERLTQMPTNMFTNAAMQWGIDTEDDAALYYEFMTDYEVETVGYIKHPVIERAGASPDRLVNDVGLVEIKCPNTSTHVETIRTQTIPKKYRLQMQWQMACTEREWCDFVSFDPRIVDEDLNYFCVRVERDQELIDYLTTEVLVFNEEIELEIARLKNG